MTERKKGPRYYQVTKTAAQSVASIMTLLAEFGAESFHVQQKDGQATAIAFVTRGVVFQLTPQLEGLRARMKKAGVSARINAEAVAWAQIRNWVELQLELIENGVLSPTQAFGGYALTSTGRTVADMLDERHGELMPGESRLLPPGT